MKLTVEEQMELYDRLCEYANDLFSAYNPCKIENGKCVDGKTCCDRGIEDWQGPACEYRGEKGCTITCLACKLWICSTARKHMPDHALGLLAVYKARAIGAGISIAHMRTTREQTEELLRR